MALDVLMAAYKVQFEVFEGPLDLLLYLVKKEEVDIYEVNLTRMATQFIEYIDLMRELDLEVAGRFSCDGIHVDAHQEPRTCCRSINRPRPMATRRSTDPRWELIRQLVEYKKFKDAAAQLQAREAEQDQIYGREPGLPDLETIAPAPRTEVSLFDLLAAVGQVLERIREREGPREIFETDGR
jgi:segregation and condensation protein A